MGFTALLSFEIKLHGVGLAARMLRAYRRYHKFPSPKNLLAPNTFSCHWLQKRNSSLCFLLLHNLACKSMCLSLAQQLFTWFLQVSLVSWQRTALRTEWSLHPSHMPAHTLPCKSHSSAGEPGSGLETPQEGMVCGFCFSFWPAMNVSPFCFSQLRCCQNLGWWNKFLLKDVSSHQYVLWTRDLLVCDTHEIPAKQIPRLICNFNYFRFPFSASIHSCSCKSQILQRQVSCMFLKKLRTI